MSRLLILILFNKRLKKILPLNFTFVYHVYIYENNGTVIASLILWLLAIITPSIVVIN